MDKFLPYNIEPGVYAKNFLLSKLWPVHFSHKARFDFGVSIVSKYNAKIVVDYGCGDGTFLSLMHTKIEKGVGIEFGIYT